MDDEQRFRVYAAINRRITVEYCSGDCRADHWSLQVLRQTHR